MYERCPVCDLRFEREPGYFLGAMYVAFFLAVPFLFSVMGLLWLATGWGYSDLMLFGGLAQLLATPVVFRYSRVIWMYLDRALFPDSL
jgi:hypothetical protein